MLLVSKQVEVTKDIVITPKQAVIYAGEGIAFHGSVYNSYMKGITWSVVSGIGTIDSNSGFYQSPTGYVPSGEYPTLIKATLTSSPSGNVYSNALVTVKSYAGVNVEVTSVLVRGMGTATWADTYSLDPEPVSGNSFTGSVYSSICTGSILDSVDYPLKEYFSIKVLGTDVYGESASPTVTGAISSNGCQGISTILYPVSGYTDLFIYEHSPTGEAGFLTNPGWPAISSVSGSTFIDVLSFGDSDGNTSSISFTWRPDTVVYKGSVPIAESKFRVNPGVLINNFSITTRDAVPQTLTVPTAFIPDSVYTIVSGGSLVPNSYTPEVPIDSIPVYTNRVYGYEEHSFPVAYELRVDSLEVNISGYCNSAIPSAIIVTGYPTGSEPGDEIEVSYTSDTCITSVTVNGGYFNNEMNIYVGSTKISSYVYDTGYFTFEMPHIDDVNNPEYKKVDMRICYGWSDGNPLVKIIPNIIISSTDLVV